MYTSLSLYLSLSLYICIYVYTHTHTQIQAAPTTRAEHADAARRTGLGPGPRGELRI